MADLAVTLPPLPTLAGAVRQPPAERVTALSAASAGGDDIGALLPPDVPEPRSPGGGLPRPAPAAPEPTIHVSIGRIEVRATPHVAPPPPAAKIPAVMGLDDYLRRRGGGGRS
jgi:hypothetical protein